MEKFLSEYIFEESFQGNITGFFDPPFIVNEVLTKIIEEEQDNAEAHFALAYCYAFGIVVNKDLKIAKEHLDKSQSDYICDLNDISNLKAYISREAAPYNYLQYAKTLKLIVDYFM